MVGIIVVVFQGCMVKSKRDGHINKGCCGRTIIICD